MITIKDISFSSYGFDVPSIKKASDKRLSRLEYELDDAGYRIEWSNIDDLGHLSVKFINLRQPSEESKMEIIRIINKIFKQ